MVRARPPFSLPGGLTVPSSPGHSRKVNVILMISDGFGPAADTFARTWVQHMHEHAPETRDGRWGFPEGFKDKDGVSDGGLGVLPLDPLLVGSSRVRRHRQQL